MTNHLMIVRDEPFPTPTITVIGKMWVPDDNETPENAPAFFEDSDFEDTFEDQIEDKMVKRGRRPARPITPTEGVETK